ncbi:unnamed protein product [Rhizoctonia solani]|uniref:Uncharacterized protein n=1 Tax=Rhizoctonia solani TaxID=456999 RepID=A0A8H3D2B4_9AGAM|nr:unnamed protein product [Rhizoctonia solani]
MSSEGRNNPRNTQSQVSGLPVFLVAEYNGRKVTIPRNTSYQVEWNCCIHQEEYSKLEKAPNNRILILAHFEEVDHHVQVTEDVWSDLLPRFTTIRVDLADDGSSDSSDGCTGGSIPSPTLPPRPQRNPRPRYQRRPVARNTGDQVSTRADVFVLGSTHQPKAPFISPTTRPSSPFETPSHSFAPASPTILPYYSVLLPFDKVTGYIDDVLLALGLHIEARTSFITYWLPDMSKHAFIALRFLPQDEYEKAAPLDVSPAPQVVTRVFMLFRGVEEAQIEYWTDAVAMAQKDASVWRDIVGVDIARARDNTLFRVLEWGGMEVK